MNDVYAIGSYLIASVALVVKLLKDDEKITVQLWQVNGYFI